MSRLSFRPSGTSPSTMRRARPSTMAVLPTPGSPISTGLFLVRRDSTWMTRRISSSRPMTGSSLPVARRLGEVAAVLLERLVLLLGVLAGDPVAAAHLAQRAQQTPRGRRRAGRPAPAAGARWTGTRRAARWRAASAASRTCGELAAQVRARCAVGLGQPLDRLVGRVAHRHGAGPTLSRIGQDHALLLAQEGDQQVVGRDLGVGVGLRRLDGGVDRLLGLERPPVRIEGRDLLHEL